MKLNELTIEDLHEKLVKKEISSEELTEDVISAIEGKDEELHAFLSTNFENARAQAKDVDKKIAQGEEIDQVAGIPVAIKDNITIKGIVTTAGSKILENYVAPYDATIIKKLREQDAVFIGKTNLDEFAMGGSTENSAFGPTKNPRDPERVPGGSSGGSAAAVAADECIWALGSDTGGSVRQPAAFCGVVGLKPTYGTVSRYGLIALGSSLDQIGPHTKTVRDSIIAFNAISGRDPMDATSVDYTFKEPEVLKDLQGVTIGVPKEYFGEGLNPEVEKIVQGALSEMERQGATLKDVSIPNSEYALPCYYITMASEASANLSRYDGIKYGSQVESEGGDLLDIYLSTRGEKMGPEVKRRIMLGTYSLSAGYYDAYYLKAQKVRAKIKEYFETALSEVDVLVIPATPNIAFKFGEKSDDPLLMYLEDIYNVSANLSGVPCVSVPCGKIDGLPVGLQIIGKHFDEAKMFQVAQLHDDSREK